MPDDISGTFERPHVHLNLQDGLIIGDNSRGYQFAVARCGNRWIGFAIGRLPDGNRLLSHFGQVHEPTEPHVAGTIDRDDCILLTSAVADDPAQGYGGIERWFLDPALRGNPDEP